MTTTIGRALTDSRPRAVGAALMAIAAVLADFLSAYSDWLSRIMPVLILLAFAGVGVFAGGDRVSLGAVLRPRQGYWYWVKVTAAVGAIVGLFCVIALTVLWILGIDFPMPTLAPHQLLPAALHSCVKAPLYEECLYRVVLCVPLVALCGPRPSIVIGGAVFAAIHVAGGRVGPDNLIAGFFLVWAYLKSETIVVPVAMHALGNSCALAAHLANWYIAT